MTILYLTEDYLHSKVHNNLIIHMLENKPDLRLYVFVPIRQRIGETLVNNFKEHERLTLITAPIDISLTRYRIDFWAKIRCKIRLIEKYIPVGEIDVIHAATLFTEGCTARALHKKYNVPYFVSMRGTDLDFYAKRMFHLWPMSRSVIKYASSIAYVTPSIKRRMIDRWQYQDLKNNLENGTIINNGVDSIWIDNLYVGPNQMDNSIRVLYIGRFDSNKNVMRLIEAVKAVRKTHNIRLTLVGGDGEEQTLVEQEVSNHSDFIDYKGKIYDKQILMQVVRECNIFAMVSHGETFGLVYVECLSQGLPIIYTLGTGFDGMYPQGKIGYGVNSFSVDSIADGLKKLISNYDKIKRNMLHIDFGRYSWSEIAKHYIDIYRTVCNDKKCS